jgi:hypothetical protein
MRERREKGGRETGQPLTQETLETQEERKRRQGNGAAGVNHELHELLEWGTKEALATKITRSHKTASFFGSAFAFPLRLLRLLR